MGRQLPFFWHSRRESNQRIACIGFSTFHQFYSKIIPKSIPKTDELGARSIYCDDKTKNRNILRFLWRS